MLLGRLVGADLVVVVLIVVVLVVVDSIDFVVYIIDTVYCYFCGINMGQHQRVVLHELFGHEPNLFPGD